MQGDTSLSQNTLINCLVRKKPLESEQRVVTVADARVGGGGKLLPPNKKSER